MWSAPGSRHIVAIGGGAIGCATAYQLARAGMRVTLLERDAIASHASGKSAGNLNPLFNTMPKLVPAALDAFRIHEQVSADLASLGCARYVAAPRRRLFLCNDTEQRDELDQVAALFNTVSGFTARWLEPSELHAIEPRLASNVVRAVLCEGNRTVDAYAFTRSLAEAAARLGCAIVHEAASGVETRADRVTGVRTSRRVIACDAVVLATGPWIAETKAWLGIDVPVAPLKGEMLLMRLADGPPRCELSMGSISIYKHSEDRVWVGTTMKQSGFDAAPTPEARVQLLTGAARIMPQITDATLLEHVAALRPVSVTGEPIAARARGWQNVYVANGGGSKGILLSVRIARDIRDLVVNDALERPA